MNYRMSNSWKFRIECFVLIIDRNDGMRNNVYVFAFRGGKFITVGDRIRLPDDVTMGYIIEHLLKKQLTVVEQFHSHLEPMKFLNKDTFDEQVCFSILFWNYEIIQFRKTRYSPKLWNFMRFHNSKISTIITVYIIPRFLPNSSILTIPWS